MCLYEISVLFSYCLQNPTQQPFCYTHEDHSRFFNSVMWKWPITELKTDPASQGKWLSFGTNPVYHQVYLESQLSNQKVTSVHQTGKQKWKSYTCACTQSDADLQQDHQQSLKMAWCFSCDLILQVGLILCKRAIPIHYLIDFLTILRRKQGKAKS